MLSLHSAFVAPIHVLAVWPCATCVSLPLSCSVYPYCTLTPRVLLVRDQLGRASCHSSSRMPGDYGEGPAMGLSPPWNGVGGFHGLNH